MAKTWADILRTIALGEALAFFVFFIYLIYRIRHSIQEKRWGHFAKICTNPWLVISYFLCIVYISLVTILSIGTSLTFRAPLAIIILTLGILGLLRKVKDDEVL